MGYGNSPDPSGQQQQSQQTQQQQSPQQSGSYYNLGADAGQRTPQEQTTNNFLHSNYTAGLYNLAGAAGNLGTMTGLVAPQAADFLSQLFNPQLNSMEQTFLQSGTDSALQAQNQAMLRAEQQFENTPFHSGLNQARQNIVNDTTRNLAQAASQAGLQRQQLATSASQFPFEYTLNAANTGAQAGERLFNLSNQAYATPYQIPLSVYSQLPISAPTIATQQGGGGGKL